MQINYMTAEDTNASQEILPEGGTEQLHTTGNAGESVDNGAEAHSMDACSAECESGAAADDNADNTGNRYTMAYCLEQIEAIQRQTSGMEDMLRDFEKMVFGVGDGKQTFDADRSLAMMETFRDTVKCRETTNQQLLTFYSKMYDDLKEASEKEPADPVKEKARLQERLIDMYQEVAISNGYEADEMSDVMNGILDSIRHL